MTQEEIRRQSLLREQAIAAGMPEDLGAISPSPKMSPATAALSAGLKVGGVSQADIDEARRLADMKIAKSHMAQIEVERQQRIENQLKARLESVKKEIAQRRVDRAERQFQIAKDVYNKGGDAQELSDRFRLDLLGELSDSFWDETPEEKALMSLEQKANVNTDSGFWGYSSDELERMKQQEQAKKWNEQSNDVASKMWQTPTPSVPSSPFSAEQINTAAAGLRQGYEPIALSPFKAQQINAASAGLQTDVGQEPSFWGYSGNDLARMKREEEARKWAEQYNDVAGKMQTSFADAPNFTADQINAAAAGLGQQAYTGLDTGLSDQKEAEIRAAYLRKKGGQPYITDGQYDEYLNNEYLMQQIMGPGYKDSYTNFWGMTTDQLGAMKKAEEQKAEEDRRKERARYNETMAWLGGTWTYPENRTKEGYPAEAENAYWRYRNGSSLPGDKQYAQYYPDLAKSYEDNGQLGMWGLTADQMYGMKKAEEQKAAEDRRKEREQYNETMANLLPEVKLPPSPEELNDVNAKLQPPETSTGEFRQTEYNPKAYSQRDDEKLTPSEILEKYQYLLQQYKDNPNMDFASLQALKQTLQKGYEKLDYYVDLYDNADYIDNSTGVSREFANKADEVAGELSDVINGIPTREEPGDYPAEAVNAYWRYKNGQMLPGDEQYAQYFERLSQIPGIAEKEPADFAGKSGRELNDLSLQRIKAIEEANKPQVTSPVDSWSTEGAAYQDKDDSDLTPSQTVEKYRYLIKLFKANPNMDEASRQAFMQVMRKGYETVDSYVFQYDRLSSDSKNPAITQELANSAAEVADYLSGLIYNNDEYFDKIREKISAVNATDVGSSSVKAYELHLNSLADANNDVLTSMSKYAEYAKVGGNALTAISYIPDAIDLIETSLDQNIETEDKMKKGITTVLGGATSYAGTLIGAKLGAIAGSAIPIPVVGTIIGAIAGGIIGGIIGEIIGENAGGSTGDLLFGED